MLEGISNTYSWYICLGLSLWHHRSPCSWVSPPTRFLQGWNTHLAMLFSHQSTIIACSTTARDLSRWMNFPGRFFWELLFLHLRPASRCFLHLLFLVGPLGGAQTDMAEESLTDGHQVHPGQRLLSTSLWWNESGVGYATVWWDPRNCFPD